MGGWGRERCRGDAKGEHAGAIYLGGSLMHKRAVLPSQASPSRNPVCTVSLGSTAKIRFSVGQFQLVTLCWVFDTFAPALDDRGD